LRIERAQRAQRGKGVKPDDKIDIGLALDAVAQHIEVDIERHLIGIKDQRVAGVDGECRDLPQTEYGLIFG